MTQTMRERLNAVALDAAVGHARDGDCSWLEVAAPKIVDAILAELQSEADRKPDQSHEGMIYEMARAIGLADTGTDLEGIGSGRGSYQIYTECAKAAFTAMIGAIREGK